MNQQWCQYLGDHRENPENGVFSTIGVFGGIQGREYSPQNAQERHKVIDGNDPGIQYNTAMAVAVCPAEAFLRLCCKRLKHLAQLASRWLG